jgi:hypothetical protein
MQEIYLDGWAAFQEEHDTGVREAPETFDWIWLDKRMRKSYEAFRSALDHVTGARDWLRAVSVARLSGSIFEALAQEAPSDHSLTSWLSICRGYHAALYDWDRWVLEVKTREARIAYKRKQISLVKLRHLIEDATGARPLDELLGGYRLISDGNDIDPGSHAELIGRLEPLVKELAEMRAQQEQLDATILFDSWIERLEFHLENPIRWFDSPRGSNLIGLPQEVIQEEHFVEMERRWPGYRTHIDTIIFLHQTTRWTLTAQQQADLLHMIKFEGP